jgi:hypothetical protein
MQLYPVNDSTELSRSNVYQIDCILYRFTRITGTARAPQYHFSPLAGQRKKADIQINYKKLINRCKLVQGMSVNSEVVGQAVQLSFI